MNFRHQSAKGLDFKKNELLVLPASSVSRQRKPRSDRAARLEMRHASRDEFVSVCARARARTHYRTNPINDVPGNRLVVPSLPRSNVSRTRNWVTTLSHTQEGMHELWLCSTVSLPETVDHLKERRQTTLRSSSLERSRDLERFASLIPLPLLVRQ